MEFYTYSSVELIQQKNGSLVENQTYFVEISIQRCTTEKLQGELRRKNEKG